MALTPVSTTLSPAPTPPFGQMKALLMRSKSGNGAKVTQCQVCGDESSGFHYGVDSCEGCKGFFRRCITQGMHHKCANDHKCEITPFTRNSCQSCRLQKCIRVGMSRDASRLGRRPKRLKDSSGESNSRSHMTNLPIAPAPHPSSVQDLNKLTREDLQRLVQANGTLQPEVMQAIVSAAQKSFREHAKTAQGAGQMASPSSSSSTGVVAASSTSSNTPYHHHKQTNKPNNSNNNMPLAQQSSSIFPSSSTIITTTASNSSTSPVSIFSSAAASSGIASSSNQPQPSDIYGDSNSNFILSNAPSPFNDLALGLAELSPLDPSAALGSMHGGGSVSGKMTPGGYIMGNFNGNNAAAFSPGSASDMPSPLGIPGMDQVDLAASPSTFMNLNPGQVIGDGGYSTDPLSPSSAIFNNNMAMLAGSSMDSMLSPQQLQHTYNLDSKANLNLSVNVNVSGQMSGPSSSGSGLLSPSAIKQEPDIDFSPSSVQKPTRKKYFVNPNNNSLANIKQVLAEVKETPTQQRRLLIDQVIDAIVEAHMSTTLNTQERIREANARIAQQDSMNQHHAPDMMMPEGGRQDPNMMWQHILNSMVPEITKLVRFSKKLPGFTEVSQEDQITLIKQGCFEVMMARITLLVDHVNDTMIDPSLKMKSPRAIIRKMQPLGKFLDEFFSIAKATNPLNLTDGENGLFGAILMTCPDRRGLRSVTEIRTIQQLYLQALYLLMRNNHRDADETFCRLIATIPQIRRVNDDHFRVLNDIRMKSGTEFDNLFPDLHRDIFDLQHPEDEGEVIEDEDR